MNGNKGFIGLATNPATKKTYIGYLNLPKQKYLYNILIDVITSIITTPKYKKIIAVAKNMTKKKKIYLHRIK